MRAPRSIFALSLSLVWLLATVNCGDNGSTGTTIAVAADLSSNDTSAIGKAVLFGAKFAADQHGYSIVTFDDRNDPKVAIAHAFRIAADRRIVAVIGHASSGLTGAAEEVYGRYGVPLLMPVATDSSLTIDSAKHFNRNAFRLVPNNDTQADALAEFVLNKAQEHHAAAKSRRPRPSVILAHNDSRYAADLLHKVKATLKQRDIDLINDHEDPNDFNPVLQRVRLDGVDVVLYVGYYNDSANLVRQIRSLATDEKYPVPVPIILGDGAFQDRLFDELGQNRQDTFVAFPAPDWNARPSVAKLVDAYRRSDHNSGFSLSFAPFAADAVELIANIIGNSPTGTGERERIIASLGAQAARSALTGNYQFNAVGDPEHGKYFMYKLSTTANAFDLLVAPNAGN